MCRADIGRRADEYSEPPPDSPTICEPIRVIREPSRAILSNSTISRGNAQ